MKEFLSFIKGTCVWVLLLLVLYFGGDIIAKGHALNSITPFPVFGVVLWVLILGLLWWLFLGPVWSFCHLKSALKGDAWSGLETAMKELSKQKDKTDDEMELLREIACTINHPDADKSPERVKELYARYREIARLPRVARKLILTYSKIAGVAVVVSRNNWLDGLILLVVQMKLVVELARLYGYRPSTVFNTLCFGWVVTNSVVNALIAQQVSGTAADLAMGGIRDIVETAVSGGSPVAGAVEAAPEMAVESVDDVVDQCVSVAMEEDFPTSGPTGAIAAVPWVGQALAVIAKPVIRVLVEAVFSGATVYTTGHIFLLKLEGEIASIDPKSKNKDRFLKFRRFMEIRKEGRKALFGLFLSKDTLTGMKDTVWNVLTKRGEEAGVKIPKQEEVQKGEQTQQEGQTA